MKLVDLLTRITIHTFCAITFSICSEMAAISTESAGASTGAGAIAIDPTATESIADVEIPETLNRFIQQQNIFRYDEADIEPFVKRIAEITLSVERDPSNWYILVDFMTPLSNMTQKICSEYDKTDLIVYTIMNEYLADMSITDYPPCYTYLLNRLNRYMAKLNRILQTLESVNGELSALLKQVRQERS